MASSLVACDCDQNQEGNARHACLSGAGFLLRQDPAEDEEDEDEDDDKKENDEDGNEDGYSE